MIEPSFVIAVIHGTASRGQFQPGADLSGQKEKGFFVVKLALVDFYLLFKGEADILPDISFGNAFDPYVRGCGGA